MENNFKKDFSVHQHMLTSTATVKAEAKQEDHLLAEPLLTTQELEPQQSKDENEEEEINFMDKIEKVKDDPKKILDLWLKEYVHKDVNDGKGDEPAEESCFDHETTINDKKAKPKVVEGLFKRPKEPKHNRKTKFVGGFFKRPAVPKHKSKNK